MTDKLENAIAKGKRAKLLMEDETMVSAFDAVRADFLSNWLNSTQTEDREKCWMAIHVIEHVKAKLHGFIADGKIAQSEVDN